jgi:hypothetical protein
MLSVSYENLDSSKFDEISRSLEKFHQRDYQPAVDQLKKMFPESWSKIPLRTCPFVYSIARELGSLYSVEPSRTFNGINNPDTTSAIKRLYRDLRITETMRQAHEYMIIQAACGILCLPDSDGRITPMVLAPWRIKPIRNSPLVTDERSVKEWRIRLPRKETLLGQIQEEDLILTQETITWANGDPFFDTPENPIGPAIPLIILRASPPYGGTFFPAPNADLLDAQLSLIIGHSDLGAIVHSQAWGQRCITGGGMEATEVQVGPDTVIALEENHDFKIVSGDANVDGFVNSMEAYLKIVLSQNKVDPSAMLSSGAYTAASRIVERSDRELERRVHIKECMRAEQRLYRHIARWINAARGINVFPVQNINVEVEFHEFSAPFDPLHESQASMIRAETGMESIVEQIARERGISVAEAEEVLERNLEVHKKIKMASGAQPNINPGLEVAS